MANVVTVTGIGGAVAGKNQDSGVELEAVAKDSTVVNVDANAAPALDPNANTTGKWRSESTIPSNKAASSGSGGAAEGGGAAGGGENPWLTGGKAGGATKKRSRNRKRKNAATTDGSGSSVDVGSVLAKLMTEEEVPLKENKTAGKKNASSSSTPTKGGASVGGSDPAKSQSKKGGVDSRSGQEELVREGTPPHTHTPCSPFLPPSSFPFSFFTSVC